MGLLMVILEITQYRVLLYDLRIEAYALIIGVAFLAFGIWLGSSAIRKKKNTPAFNARKLGLSKRELEVLILLSEGLSNQEIADRLFVSLNTVKTHISKIYQKLNAKRRTQAIQKARELELVENTNDLQNHSKV